MTKSYFLKRTNIFPKHIVDCLNVLSSTVAISHVELFKLIKIRGNSLVVQWLGLCAFTAEGLGSVSGWGTKILQAVQRGLNK